MEIEDIAKIEPKIENGKLIIYFTSNPVEITDLRVLRFIDKLKPLMNDLHNDKIKEFFFVFNINDIVIPTNFSMLKVFAQFFKDSEDVIIDKLKFSVVESKSNIFKLFFSLFKKYYVPKKSLYLCKSIEDVNDCIFNIDSRNKYPNILNLI